jgi:hypothetical protein
MFDHVGRDFVAGHDAGPCRHRTVIELARYVLAFGNLGQRGLLDLEIALGGRGDNVQITFGAVELGQQSALNFGRVLRRRYLCWPVS